MRPRLPSVVWVRSSNIAVAAYRDRALRGRGESLGIPQVDRAAFASRFRCISHCCLYISWHNSNTLSASFPFFRMHHGSPARSARTFGRIGFGLALAFMGFAHYQDPQFAPMVAQDLRFLTPVGLAWGYVLPALMILGGLLLAFGIYLPVAAACSAIALASIPAGLLLKSVLGDLPLEQSSGMAVNAFVWLATLLLLLKGSCTSGSCCPCGPGTSSQGAGAKMPAQTPAMTDAKAAVSKKTTPSTSATKKRAAPRKRVSKKRVTATK